MPIDAEHLEEAFKEQLSFHGRSGRMKRFVAQLGWVVAGIVGPAALIEALAINHLIHRPDPEPRIAVVDRATGWVGEAMSLKDAPKVFDRSEAVHYLSQFIDAAECYIPEKDQSQWNTIRAMSSADQMDRYNDWRKSPDAPVKRLGMDGHVDCFNYVFDSDPVKLQNDTWEYVVRFDMRETSHNFVAPVRHIQKTVDFQWHPDMKMSPEDRRINYPGMQVIHYPLDKG